MDKTTEQIAKIIKSHNISFSLIKLRNNNYLKLLEKQKGLRLKTTNQILGIEVANTTIRDLINLIPDCLECKGTGREKSHFSNPDMIPPCPNCKGSGKDVKRLERALRKEIESQDLQNRSRGEPDIGGGLGSKVK